MITNEDHTSLWKQTQCAGMIYQKALGSSAKNMTKKNGWKILKNYSKVNQTDSNENRHKKLNKGEEIVAEYEF